MLSILTSPVRWLRVSNRDVLDNEDAHELLGESESESSNRPVARWTQPHGALFTRSIKVITAASVTFGLLAGFVIFHRTGQVTDPEPESPEWPWQAYTRYSKTAFQPHQ